ncbi:Callose synthase 4 [Hordeum vulgare]|nr:Callose synthase 4 [Hordeum vulgare]
MIAESVATLARWARGTASSAEKEHPEELGGKESVPDSRFRAAARSSARSGTDGAGEPAGLAASKRALRQDAITGVEVDRGRRAYATVRGRCPVTGVITASGAAAVGECSEARTPSESPGGGSEARGCRQPRPPRGDGRVGVARAVPPSPPMGAGEARPGGQGHRARQRGG